MTGMTRITSKCAGGYQLDPDIIIKTFNNKQSLIDYIGGLEDLRDTRLTELQSEQIRLEQQRFMYDIFHKNATMSDILKASRQNPFF